jgi:hypothetical protein
MDKFLLLPMALLLSNCNGSKPVNNTQPDAQPKVEQTSSQQQATSQDKEQNAPIEQGIKGKILWQSGNQMPSPDLPQGSGKRGVQRTVYVYELTNSSQTQSSDGVFHTNIQTNLVTQVVTDADGNFAVSLKPGKYSLFTKEEKGLYANLFDGKMNIFPVEVKKGEVSTVEFLINYQASY